MQQEPARVYQGSPPSAIRGWLTRLGGVLTFNKRRVFEGKNEINDARVYRQYEHDVKRARRRQSRPQSRDRYDRDRGYATEKPGLFLHYPHRCRPTYHGAHFRLWGFLTRRREHITRGLSMHEEAERERRRERRRRLRRSEVEGLAIRHGAKEVMHADRSHSGHHHSRSHRRHGSRSDRNGFAPFVTTADVGRGGAVVAVPATTQAIPVARSTSAHGHGRHRHHSSQSMTAPLVTTVSSRNGHGHRSHHSRSHSHSRHNSYSGTTTPVVQVAHSQYTSNGAAGGLPVVAVSRAASSRHHYDDRVVPVVRSSSRHESARYGDPALSRTSSSRHGHHRYGHGHSRQPTEMYVSA